MAKKHGKKVSVLARSQIGSSRKNVSIKPSLQDVKSAKVFTKTGIQAQTPGKHGSDKLTSGAHKSNNSINTSSHLKKSEILASTSHAADTNSEDYFQWMIGSDVSAIEFFEDYWEQKPLHVKRSSNGTGNDFAEYFSKGDLDKILRQDVVRFGINLDVTSCVDGVRSTLTPQGRAYPGCVWDFYESGCSIRMLNPQSFHEPVWRMLSILQNFFLCGMGANVYFTPKNTQGFAPHFDDIEAFVLQTEGSKRWRVYAPESEEEFLPRHSSSNYTAASMEGRVPVIDTVLHAGDMIYFPRGWVHQANATDEDSTHVTVSTYQNHSWATFMEKAVPHVLSNALAMDPSFRTGLPLGFLKYMGVAMSESENPSKVAGRAEFVQKFRSLWANLGVAMVEELDQAADELAVHVMTESVPPLLTRQQVQHTSAAGVHTGVHAGCDVKSLPEPENHDITEETCVCVVREHVSRIVQEGKFATVYHILENGKCREYPPQTLNFHSAYGPIVEFFLQSESDGYVRVGDAFGLQIDMSKEDDEMDNGDGNELMQAGTRPASADDVFEVVTCLYDAGLLMRKKI
ncbi:hypothetical protein SARC_05289 [Sphaeroforma arctica JP610]|uniref:Bifunctional lysine-specific demethylase and histidyl-hydroxylase n=1 Tax=Sphaeroforma arctica JP610 TaxID=667725 RepID=A0A0L0G2J5_9EUKA|nr:hypothetical protein SARC_05289 [Sphaeroforma arctica JP610]KNC82418.1 hypothetical protein SARC_05289 [Sphaeroforma arctica JP610]|eukprot:XP_014156320.1 hypothetical protein SARC_05289 [Sphaeroforma arctica JP610]